MENDFLELLSRRSGLFTFQTFPDAEADKGNDVRRRQLTRVFNGTPAQHRQQLEQLNAAGAGIFVTVNETDGLGRKLANFRDIRAYYVEVDGHGEEAKWALYEKLLDSAQPPSAVIDSRNGLHAYWFTDPGESLQHWDEIQHGIRHAFGGDPRSKDLVRVLRLPGYLHQKDPAAPYPITVLHLQDVRYTAAELAAAFPAPAAPPQPQRSYQRPQQASLSRMSALQEYAAVRWERGGRHALALSVAARLWWWKVPLHDAEVFVEEICRYVGDDDLPDRLQAVRDTYRAADSGAPVASPELRGVTFHQRA